MIITCHTKIEKNVNEHRLSHKKLKLTHCTLKYISLKKHIFNEIPWQQYLSRFSLTDLHWTVAK